MKSPRLSRERLAAVNILLLNNIVTIIISISVSLLVRVVPLKKTSLPFSLLSLRGNKSSKKLTASSGERSVPQPGRRSPPGPQSHLDYTQPLAQSPGFLVLRTLMGWWAGKGLLSHWPLVLREVTLWLFFI